MCDRFEGLGLLPISEDTLLSHGVVDKWVSLEYVEKSDIAKELQDQGYDVGWNAANKESERVDLEGWQPVLLSQPDGTHARLKIHDHPAVGGYLIFLKRRKS